MKQQFDHSPKKQKIPGLDGLRGIAILGVIGYHLAPGIFPGGFLGVNLFFVLSGYLMAVTSGGRRQAKAFMRLPFTAGGPRVFIRLWRSASAERSVSPGC